MRIFTPLFFLFLFQHSFGQETNAENDKKLILGKWISSQDRKSAIVFTDSTCIDIYDGKAMETYSYTLKKDRLTETGSDGDIYEYDVMGLSKTKLTLMYLSRGNLLFFEKAKKRTKHKAVKR
jgi:hypothetical protein